MVAYSLNFPGIYHKNKMKGKREDLHHFLFNFIKQTKAKVTSAFLASYLHSCLSLTRSVIFFHSFLLENCMLANSILWRRITTILCLGQTRLKGNNCILHWKRIRFCRNGFQAHYMGFWLNRDVFPYIKHVNSCQSLHWCPSENHQIM